MSPETISTSKLESMSRGELIALAKRGIIKVMLASVIPTSKTEMPEYKRNSDLHGKPISLSEAARKYGVPFTTLRQWKDKGLIRILGYDKNRLLVDEGEVAYCAEIRKSNPGAGKWLFNPDGTPYTPKR